MANSAEEPTQEDSKFTLDQIFHRQSLIEGWDQEKLSKQTALCLGIGGLGSVVSMNLCRLGIKKIFLVDHDVVDVSNLNRQLLFSKNDVGKSKVECAERTLRELHNIADTEIIGLQIDAVKKWDQIVEIAKQSDVIFNMIDVGDHFDLAVQGLALSLEIPLIQGGTFCQTITIDYITPDGQPCLSCLNDGLDEKTRESFHPHKIQEYENIDFLPPNDNPVGQSNVYLCGICAMLMTSFFSSHIIADPDVRLPYRVIMYVNSGESIPFFDAIQEDLEKCTYCSKPKPEGEKTEGEQESKKSQASPKEEDNSEKSDTLDTGKADEGEVKETSANELTKLSTTTEEKVDSTRAENEKKIESDEDKTAASNGVPTSSSTTEEKVDPIQVEDSEAKKSDEGKINTEEKQNTSQNEDGETKIEASEDQIKKGEQGGEECRTDEEKI
eukprot:CAMPEP_0115021636 /NCGR_PEP_ID=MMETSP0216-20121206/31019_1 /TAXON_ID=223996 /ORGANISM="Protocruzia adherens, Strain Boccale" /LENGTH=439 /DNA_ID=CAMNT_0002394059 /DNA_START=64 /DNA_END=1383 /DNA_ORIENTATION=+